MTLADLKAQLDQAIEQEDYDLAARIRDTLQHKQSDARLAVEDANRRFYDAFASGRIEEMSKVWGKGDHVQTIHPGAGVIAGREQVMESWRAVLKGVRPRAFRIAIEDVRVWASDASGVVTCTEVVDADDSQGRTIATNVFEKQGGKWVITHHHGSPLMRSFR
ncbi:hypothetical protein Rsub_13381 [Raphidocelis subcapitata]|uniref:SnoaL-like domain-containing protein n=1 Tax=Raphidocelis subcapitata TaxID=307507 RepID=A0A2V0PLM3_9CHLO|nr:hypothetical protein Rsub_13381 [Raphidocelis subcapitata]|eukprot:GBG00627.1 hypothetical protein Rsub_13381 [Raphidocelis subcapitata]